MIDLLFAFRHPHHPIRLNVEFRRDLQWWLQFFEVWNGSSFFCLPGSLSCPSIVVTSDAAASVGFGALWDTAWFCQSWSFLPSQHSIAFQELVPIVVASLAWGPSWSRARVLFRCDNSAAVTIINKGSSKVPELMHLLRVLTRVACLNSFVFGAQHLSGADNLAADALSRFQIPRFRRLVPNAASQPTPILPSVLRSLVPPS